MNIPRGDIRTVTIDPSHLTHYAIGGFISTDFCHASSVVEIYDIVENKWILETNLTYPRGAPSLGALNDQIFAIGGETKDATCVYSIPVP